jgi:PAS domain S-box-containing protein
MSDGVLEKHSIMDELLAILARTADGVFALDQAERVVFWNAAAERITGYQADEVLGRPCYEIFGSEQRAGCHHCQPDCPVIRAARNQEPVPTYNVLVRTKADVPILLNISVIVPLESHESVCTIHLFRDATHQLRYETYVEQILSAAAQLAGPQQALAQHASQVRPLFAPLSAREKEVLGLLVQGKSAREIAETLGISYVTVRNHLQALLRKFGVHTQRQVIKLALQHHLV